jgi:hypothetical protein
MFLNLNANPNPNNLCQVLEGIEAACLLSEVKEEKEGIDIM